MAIHRTKFIPRLLLIATGVVTLVMLANQLTEAQTNSVMIEINNITMNTSAEADAPVFINPNEDSSVSAYTTRITYDSTTIEVITCTPLNFTGVCNIDTVGQIKLSGIHVYGVEEKTQIATLRIKT